MTTFKKIVRLDVYIKSFADLNITVPIYLKYHNKAPFNFTHGKKGTFSIYDDSNRDIIGEAVRRKIGAPTTPSMWKFMTDSAINFMDQLPDIIYNEGVFTLPEEITVIPDPRKNVKTKFLMLSEIEIEGYFDEETNQIKYVFDKEYKFIVPCNTENETPPFITSSYDGLLLLDEISGDCMQYAIEIKKINLVKEDD